MTTTKRPLLLAAVADLHCRADHGGRFRTLVGAANGQELDALLLCGDLTDHGTPEEARTLAESLQEVRAPKLAVLGNHDHDSGKGEEVSAILRGAGVHVLDGDRFVLPGGVIGIAGVKGFCGGFDRNALQSFGEGPIKAFVHEAVNEALKLEAALQMLEGVVQIKIALTHYAPVTGTCAGERTELFPFLGSSRLARPLDHYGVTAAFHGHAHSGSPEGRTLGGVPVYNVALPLLRRVDDDRRLLLLELPGPAAGEAIHSSSPGPITQATLPPSQPGERG